MAYSADMSSVVIGLALLAFWLYCLFDVITTSEEEVRHLPKVLWVVVVVFLFGLGGLLWLLLGRPRAYALAGDAAAGGARPAAPRGPDDDPEFLRSLDRRLREED